MLKESFCNPPFKLANITARKKDGLQLMLMSSSPGVLDGDHYQIHIELEKGAEVELVTQGYQRLFTMKKGACQHLVATLARGASLHYLPHPTVPHKHSIFSATNHLYLQPEHTLTWSEIVTCGRKGCGEVFELTQYHNTTNIYINNKLVVKENLLLQPGSFPVTSMGQWQGYTHQSGLLFLHHNAEIDQAVAAARSLLQQQEDIAFGVSRLPVNGLIVRLLGHHAEPLFNTNHQLAYLFKTFVHANPA